MRWRGGDQTYGDMDRHCASFWKKLDGAAPYTAWGALVGHRWWLVVMETSRRTRAEGCAIAGGWLWLGTEGVVGTAAVVGTSFPFRGGRCSHWGVTLEMAFVTSDAEVNMDVGDWGKVCPGVADVTPAGEAEHGAGPTAGFTVDLSLGLHTSSEVQCRDSWEAGRGPKASVECAVDWAEWAP